MTTFFAKLHTLFRPGALVVAAALALTPLGAAAVDLNTATLEQLQTLSGIGPKTAALIIEERERGGRFTSLQDVADRVRGIGAKRLESLQAGGASVSAAPAAPTASAAPAATP